MWNTPAPNVLVALLLLCAAAVYIVRVLLQIICARLKKVYAINRNTIYIVSIHNICGIFLITCVKIMHKNCDLGRLGPIWGSRRRPRIYIYILRITQALYSECPVNWKMCLQMHIICIRTKDAYICRAFESMRILHLKHDLDFMRCSAMGHKRLNYEDDGSRHTASFTRRQHVDVDNFGICLWNKTRAPGICGGE